MPKVTQDYDWIKKERYCKWNDPAIEDYDVNIRESVLNQKWEIINIAYEDETSTIYDDTIILIDNSFTSAEVYASELEQYGDYDKQLINLFQNVRNLTCELDENLNYIRNIVGFNKMENKKTYYDGDEVTSEMIDKWFSQIEEIKNFTFF